MEDLLQPTEASAYSISWRLLLVDCSDSLIARLDTQRVEVTAERNFVISHRVGGDDWTLDSFCLRIHL